jgi:hypothetical protein
LNNPYYESAKDILLNMMLVVGDSDLDESAIAAGKILREAWQQGHHDSPDVLDLSGVLLRCPPNRPVPDIVPGPWRVSGLEEDFYHGPLLQGSLNHSQEKQSFDLQDLIRSEESLSMDESEIEVDLNDQPGTHYRSVQGINWYNLALTHGFGNDSSSSQVPSEDDDILSRSCISSLGSFREPVVVLGQDALIPETAIPRVIRTAGKDAHKFFS